ncbi:tandem-95 repeat protein [Mesorhizobium sp. M4A.F.Ca.ET.020.02.1.1]|uniref:cadherin-like domain-containing protein n=1 Tax=Mesorhizobium sp. M4A.F.Ca.ET.020.02.1.1 TaxID=2496652 RepID=UPI000FD402DF|nr:cadherin-like domain-containing protein [Mesorhizobium sp. M4A.F.Ca.ET.020.02.1.1]RVD39104.1 tandem-95 repeat protein [Mesorhizobium sp. M4A.F.Ca.ET.020.02.1.1]
MGASGSSYVGVVTDGDDKLIGGSGTDIIIAGDGNDYVNGGSGADTLDGGSGIDTLLGGSGADTLIFVSYENQYRLGGSYDGSALTGGSIYNDGVQTGLTSFTGYDNYDGGNGTVKGGTAEIDTLKIVVSVQQSNDAAFMAALNAEVAYFKNIWLPAHVNKSTGQADQSVYEFKTINLKISAIEKIAPITVDLSTNHAPVNTVPAGTQLASEDVSQPITGVSVFDPDGGILTTSVSVLNGTLTVVPVGAATVGGNGGATVTITGTAAEINAVLSSITYTGNQDYNGPDQLNITTTDALGASDADVAAISVTPVNDAPTTSPVTLAAIAEDSGARTITQAELLANAGDIEGDALVASGLAISSGGGTLDDNGDGTWTYTPDADDDTSVSFSYTITDDGTTNGGADPLSVAGSATLDITPVNDGPAAVGDTIITNLAAGSTVIIPEWALIANDPASAIDVAGVDSATGGTVSQSSGSGANGTVTFADTAPMGGTFTYTATDGTSAGAPALVTVIQDALGTLDGTSGDNILISSNGGATLVGGAGDDVLLGGSGNDIYRFGLADGNDIISDAGGGGDSIEIVTSAPVDSTAIGTLNFERVANDLVINAGTTEITIRDQYVGSSNVESIQFTNGGTVYGYALSTSAYRLQTSLSGAGTDDVIASTSAGQALTGGAGNDLLFGNGGDDSTINGGNGNDLIVGGTGNDTLLGAGDNDTLVGGDGNDTLTGGAGVDTLTGGIGSDIFNYGSISESTPASFDTIADFVHGTDKIDLSSIDANTASGGDQAFLFGGQNAATVANSITWSEVGANTIVRVDVNGNATADFQITLTGTGLGLTASDFVL